MGGSFRFVALAFAVLLALIWQQVETRRPPPSNGEEDDWVFRCTVIMVMLAVPLARTQINKKTRRRTRRVRRSGLSA